MQNANEFGPAGADFILQHAPSAVDILSRPLSVLQVDRLRTGPQWEDRRRVRELCASEWRAFCAPARNATRPGPEFWRLLRSASFLLCVHGGGLDPSPKAWEALLMGTIPIIQHFAGKHFARALAGPALFSLPACTLRFKKLLWRPARPAAPALGRQPGAHSMWSAARCAATCSAPRLAKRGLAPLPLPVRAHAGREAYRGLPVVFVDAWLPQALSEANLRRWREQLAPYYAQPDKRAEVLRRLGSDFWWGKVQAALEGRLPEFAAGVDTLAVDWRPEPVYKVS